MLSNAEIQGWAHLSPRQMDCLEALRSGHCTDKQIARAVGLEVSTVQEYLARARHLLGAHHRVQLALIAERMHESPARRTLEQGVGRHDGRRTMNGRRWRGDRTRTEQTGSPGVSAPSSTVD